MKSFKRLVVFMLVLSMVIGTMVPAFAFSDVEDTTYEDEINKLAAVGVVTGDPEGTFRPEDNITRAEVAVIICKMLGAGNTMDAQKNMPSKFSDVAVGEWYTGAINLATSTGIIAGFPDGTFRPNDNITTAQAVTLLVKALGRGVYVDAAGEWPANYIAEGAKLGVTKNVALAGESDLATRGMVAAMGWNSLDIEVWDVKETTHAGEIVSGRLDTMLEMYFKDYINEAKELKWIEDLDVDFTYITDKELAEGQIIVSGEEFDPANDIDAKEAARVKNKDTKTYINDDGELVVYVADKNVDATDLLNKKVDIMFGKDNVATLVVVREDADADLLTKVLVKDEKIVIGDNTYKLDDELVIFINNVQYKANADIEDIEDIVEVVAGVVDTKTIARVIKADAVVNSSNKVEKLSLEVSGNFTFGNIVVTQFIVEEVKDNEIKAIAESASAITIDVEDLESQDDLLTVIKDGEIASIDDIAAGDVITYTLLNGQEVEENIAVMYVSSARVNGLVTRINQKSVMTIDGTTYFANNALIGDLAKDIEDADADFDVNDVFDEEVELYLNYLGEYVAVLAETEGGDYNFGIVKKVIDDATEVDDHDAISVRILTVNGESKKYDIIGDDDDDVVKANIKTIEGAEASAFFNDEADLDPYFVAFKVTGENKIKEDEIFVINNDSDLSDVELGNEIYDIKVGTESGDDFTTDVNYDYREILGAEFTSNSVVFSLGLGAVNVADKVEVLEAGFKALVNKDDETILGTDSFIVINDDSEVEVVVVTGADGYMNSEADYAYVLDIEVAKDDAYTVKLFVEGEEKTYTTTSGAVNFRVNDFIKYDITASGKLNRTATRVLDVDAIAELDLTDSFAAGLVNKDEVINGANVYDTDKRHITVDKVTDTLVVKYDEDYGMENTGLEKEDDEFEGVIYDLTDLDAPKMITNVKDIEGKVVFGISSEATGADKYDADTRADILVVIER